MDVYRFPAFRPQAAVGGVFGDPKARVALLQKVQAVWIGLLALFPLILLLLSGLYLFALPYASKLRGRA